MTEPIWSTGGAGGEVAVLSDMNWAVSYLRDAAADAETARTELARRSAALELSPSVGQSGLANELRQLSGSRARLVTEQLEDTAQRLERVAAAYLEAELRARQRLGLLAVTGDALADQIGRGVWVAEVGTVLAALTNPVSAAFVLTGHGAAVGAALPEDAPPTTGTLTRDVAERLFGVGAYDGIVALLDRVIRGLENWLREPEFFAVVGTQVDAAPAANLEDVMRRLRETEVAGGGAVRIERWTDEQGLVHRIVYIPGTEDWTVWNKNIADVGADVALEAGRLPDMADAVAAALVADGADPGEPVLLAGHSLGGIVATALAGNPRFTERFGVRAVVTAGSPVGRLRLPSSVRALHLEGTRDVVPGLDGMANPDTPTRVTVHHDARRSEDRKLDGAARSIDSAHSLDTYAETARLVDATPSASAEVWRTAAGDFFGDSKNAVVTEYRPVTR